jgi:hypothetical protein
MNTTTLPPPDELRQRIADCEEELRALRRLLRMSAAMRSATEARERREVGGKAVRPAREGRP